MQKTLSIADASLTPATIGSTANAGASELNGPRKNAPPSGAVLGLNRTATRAVGARSLSGVRAIFPSVMARNWRTRCCCHPAERCSRQSRCPGDQTRLQRHRDRLRCFQQRCRRRRRIANKDIGPKRDLLLREAPCLIGRGGGKPVIDADVAALDPAKRLQSLPEGGETRLCFRVIAKLFPACLGEQRTNTRTRRIRKTMGRGLRRAMFGACG